MENNNIYVMGTVNKTGIPGLIYRLNKFIRNKPYKVYVNKIIGDLKDDPSVSTARLCVIALESKDYEVKYDSKGITEIDISLSRINFNILSLIDYVILLFPNGEVSNIIPKRKLYYHTNGKNIIIKQYYIFDHDITEKGIKSFDEVILERFNSLSGLYPNDYNHITKQLIRFKIR